MNAIILDVIVLALPALATIFALRYWRSAIWLVAAIVIVSIPFTPVWDSAWIFLTQSGQDEQASAETVLAPAGGRRLSTADLSSDIQPNDRDKHLTAGACDSAECE